MIVIKSFDGLPELFVARHSLISCHIEDMVIWIPYMYYIPISLCVRNQVTKLI